MRTTLRDLWACLRLLWWLACGARSWPVGVVLALVVAAGVAWARHPIGLPGRGLPGPIHRPAASGPSFEATDVLLLENGTDRLLLENGTDALLLRND